MIIIPIFVDEPIKNKCNLWSVCYKDDYQKGKPLDIFSHLFNLWNDDSYLFDFFKEHQEDLASPFWSGMSIDEAIDNVLDEANDFETELRSIELRLPGSEKKQLSDIFQELHKHEYRLKPQYKSYRKAKPSYAAMLRLYGIELEDGCIIVTGGAIKISVNMDRPHLIKEKGRLTQIRNFLKEEGIDSREGLI